jgi:hypothetical protein
MLCLGTVLLANTLSFGATQQVNWGNEISTLRISDVANVEPIDAAPVGTQIRLTIVIENLDDQLLATELVTAWSIWSDNNNELSVAAENNTLTTTFAPSLARNYTYFGIATLAELPALRFRNTNVASNDADSVGVSKLQWKSGAIWVDAPDQLFVLKDTTVTFKVVRSPAGTAWPTGKPVWGGTAGSTGSGESKEITFSAKGDKTVTVECGNTISKNVRVFILVPTMTAVDNFTDRATDKYGIMEVVNLNFTTDPTVTLAQAGGLKWIKTSGVGEVSSQAASDGTGTYSAGATEGNSSLSLVIQDGPSQGRSPDPKVFTVVKPSGGYCVQKENTNIWHDANRFSIGIKTDFFLEPRDVSFSGVKFKEGDCVAAIDGWFVTQGFGQLPHDADDNGWVWMPVGVPTNATIGSKVTLPANFDTAELWANPPFQAYHAGPGGGVSTFTWPIPWLYSTTNGTSEVQFFTMNQIFTVNANGLATVSKGGASGQVAHDADDQEY